MSFARRFTWEDAMLAFLIIGSFVGIWFGAPLVDVSADEMYFVGGVFRALEAHSLIPLPGDVPYGTLTFYLNYLFEIPVLLFIFVIHHANMGATKAFLITNPIVGYVVTRCVSAVIVSFFVWWYNRFLKTIGLPLLQRAAVLSVALMTILPVYMLHTGKMWVLSTVLATMALVYGYQALSNRDSEKGQRYAFWCVVVSGLAAANFPLAGLLLLNIPVLWFADRSFRRSVGKATLIAIASVGVVFAINARNIVLQVYDIFFNYHAVFTPQAQGSIKISSLASLGLHAEQIAIVFPLTLALVLFAVIKRARGNGLLQTFAFTYMGMYGLVLVFLVTWNNDPFAFLRHMLPLAFFLSLLVASFNFERIRSALLVFLFLQTGFYVYALCLLSLPMTYNVARTYIMNTYASKPVVLFDHIEAIDFPLNRATAALTKDGFCQSKCVYVRTASTEVAFTPTVITTESDSTKLGKTSAYLLYIGTTTLPSSCSPRPIATFLQSAPSEVALEYQFGSYFAPLVTRLGQNLYLEEFKQPCEMADFGAR